LQHPGQHRLVRFYQLTLADLSEPADLNNQRNDLSNQRHVKFSSGVFLNLRHRDTRGEFKQLEPVWCDFKHAHIGDDHVDHAHARQWQCALG